MKKNTTPKSLKLSTTTIVTLSERALADAAGGLMLTRPYTKVSICQNGGPCASELCY
jgi:hypothetical protein